ncbi:Uncharacterised protein [Legionella lansingensis]|uniref:Uncharacterized protein n=1 Tax=Legionella lansingensis TaxID=45067 RepID=A0A0W0VLB3_9GAMM|nr:hypothetical protein [Legionella lansingensis]KTD20862.1 hypothetical protein Llan_1592 [Legionella lansingensis]SNV43527.1 Uncharacterised protein [Legionella lansingensis]
MLKAFGFYKETNVPKRMELLTKTFNYKSQEHLDFIQNRITRFKQAQAALYNYDNTIISSLTVGLVFYAGGSIIPFLPSFAISIGGFSYASYLVGNREQAGLVRPYREALTDLIEVYQWSMGNKTDTWWKLGVLEIQDLILTLGPMVRKETIAVWEEKDLQPGALLSRGKEPTEAFKTKATEFAAGTQMQSIWFAVYGENGNDDILGMATAYLKHTAQGAAEKYAPAPLAGYLGLR